MSREAELSLLVSETRSPALARILRHLLSCECQDSPDGEGTVGALGPAGPVGPSSPGDLGQTGPTGATGAAGPAAPSLGEGLSVQRNSILPGLLLNPAWSQTVVSSRLASVDLLVDGDGQWARVNGAEDAPAFGELVRAGASRDCVNITMAGFGKLGPGGTLGMSVEFFIVSRDYVSMVWDGPVSFSPTTTKTNLSTIGASLSVPTDTPWVLLMRVAGAGGGGVAAMFQTLDGQPGIDFLPGGGSGIFADDFLMTEFDPATEDSNASPNAFDLTLYSTPPIDQYLDTVNTPTSDAALRLVTDARKHAVLAEVASDPLVSSYDAIYLDQNDAVLGLVSFSGANVNCELSGDGTFATTGIKRLLYGVPPSSEGPSAPRGVWPIALYFPGPAAAVNPTKTLYRDTTSTGPVVADLCDSIGAGFLAIVGDSAWANTRRALKATPYVLGRGGLSLFAVATLAGVPDQATATANVAALLASVPLSIVLFVLRLSTNDYAANLQTPTNAALCYLFILRAVRSLKPSLRIAACDMWLTNIEGAPNTGGFTPADFRTATNAAIVTFADGNTFAVSGAAMGAGVTFAGGGTDDFHFASYSQIGADISDRQEEAFGL